MRRLSIPCIRDRVVQGALKLIVEPVFEADFQAGSFGYRPKRTAHQAVIRVADAIVVGKTRVIDIDLKAYFDGVRHDLLLSKVAARVDDDDVLHLLKIMLKANGKQGVPQGGVISPMLSNLYLNEVDRMLERAKEATRNGKYTYVAYARFADDLVILIDAHPRHDWLLAAVDRRLREEFAELQVDINEAKSRTVDLGRRRKSTPSSLAPNTEQPRHAYRPPPADFFTGDFRTPSPGASGQAVFVSQPNGEACKVDVLIAWRPPAWRVAAEEGRHQQPGFSWSRQGPGADFYHLNTINEEPQLPSRARDQMLRHLYPTPCTKSETSPPESFSPLHLLTRRIEVEYADAFGGPHQTSAEATAAIFCAARRPITPVQSR